MAFDIKKFLTENKVISELSWKAGDQLIISRERPGHAPYLPIELRGRYKSPELSVVAVSDGSTADKTTKVKFPGGETVDLLTKAIRGKHKTGLGM